MAYENLTTFTEHPASGYFTQTTTRNTANAIIRNCDVYVDKSYGVDHFGDYEHLLDLYYGTADDSGHVGLWGVTNDPGSWADMSQGQHIYLYDSAGNGTIALGDFGLSNWDFYQPGVMDGTTYYLTIERNGTTLTCKIYSDSERTDELDVLTLTCQNTAEEYALCGNSRESGASPNAVFNGYCENFDLQEAPPAPYFEVESSDATSTVSGSLDSQPKLIGSTTGVSGADGSLDSQSGLIGSATGVSDVFGILDVIRLAGSTTGTSGVNGVFNISVKFYSSAAGISDVSGDLSGVSYWISPIGHNEPAGGWLGETQCYDENTATKAYSDMLDPGVWTSWLELIPPSMEASKVRYWTAYCAIEIDLDIYVPGTGWITILNDFAIPAYLQWVEVELGAKYNLTKVRVRFKTNLEQPGRSDLFEFDFWGELLPITELRGSSVEVSNVDGSIIGVHFKIKGSATGVSGADGSLSFIETLQGFTTGISGVDGSLDSQPGLISSAIEVSNTFGVLNVAINLVSSIDGTLSANGVLDVAISLIGSTNEILNVNGVFNTAISLVGFTDGVADIDGWLGFLISIIGSTVGVSGVAGRFEPVLIGFYESLTNQITSYFNAFADVNDLAVRYDNDPRPTPSSGLWCECGVDLGSTEQSELGVNSFRNVSNFSIRIKNSIGLGTNELLEKADIVATTFRRKNLNRIIFKVPRIVKVGRIEDNYQVNVICPFFVDKVGN